MIDSNESVGAKRYTRYVVTTSCGMNRVIKTSVRSPRWEVSTD
jgi:hypothetical protein